MKNQSYNSFWQRIHKQARKKSFPLRIMFELTYRCNFKCKHCYVPQSYRKKGELKTKHVFSILDQLKDIGCFYLGFTGGEPFVREDIFDILWYAKKKGFELIIYTNGSLINEENANELQRLRPNKIDITIPAMSKDAFESISGVKGSRDNAFKAIDLLHKKGVNLGFKTCVLAKNENEIKEIENFAASLGARHRLDDMLMPCLDGSKEPYRYRGQRPEISKKSETQICQLDTTGYGLLTIDLFKCGVGRSQAAITPLGELKMCLMIDYPRYWIQNTENRKQKTENGEQRTDLGEAWERLKGSVAAIKPDKEYKCDKCELRSDCKWCVARSWLYNRRFTSCEPESRRKAELTRQNIKDKIVVGRV